MACIVFLLRFLYICLPVIAIGCNKPVEQKKESTKTNIWVDGTQGKWNSNGPNIVLIHVSWPNGESLAICVPYEQDITAWENSALTKAKKPPQRVFISICDGAIYQNDKKISDFPKPDNRCYILGSDYQLHDSGRSAEWALGPQYGADIPKQNLIVSESMPLVMKPLRDLNGKIVMDNGEVNMYDGVPGYYSKEELENPENKVELYNRFSFSYTSNSKYYKQRIEFFKKASELAFKDGTIYCPPWFKPIYKEGSWIIDKRFSVDDLPKEKWIISSDARPKNWSSSYPKEDHNWIEAFNP